MDDATKQALAELKATADRFCATVDRAIQQEDADTEEIRRLAGEICLQSRWVEFGFAPLGAENGR